jgi:hypothetical protein
MQAKVLTHCAVCDIFSIEQTFDNRDQERRQMSTAAKAAREPMSSQKRTLT